MRTRLSAFVAAACVSAVLAMVVVVRADEIARAVPGSSGLSFDCVVHCTNGNYTVGTCYGNQSCCGYRNCSTGSEFNTCCSGTQHCHQDLNAVPPISECVANP